MKFMNYLVVWMLSIPLFMDARLICKKTIEDFVKSYPDTTWIKCTQKYPFSYPEFALYPVYKDKFYPNQGYHSDISILEIPNGIAHVDVRGHIFVNDVFIVETQIKSLEPFHGNEYIERPDLGNVPRVAGRVAVVNHLYPHIYGLFLLDILGTIALLEMCGIEYDYLWTPYDQQFVRDAFAIWGMDSSKIIPLHFNTVLQADTIILPTSISQNDVMVFNVNYYPDFILKYVHYKMLAGVEKMNIIREFPEKIFVSRQDASFSRKVPNEDDVFALFEPLGYVRYEFSKLSMAEKIAVSNHAKRIVSFMGSGSANILFASSDAQYIEIMQGFVEATFFYIANVLGLKYLCIDGSSIIDLFCGAPYSYGRALDLNLVQNFIAQHPDL